MPMTSAGFMEPVEVVPANWQLIMNDGPRATLPTTWLMSGAGQQITVSVRRNKQARRLVLRIRPATNDALLTLPPRAGVADAADFVRERGDWLAEQFRSLPQVTRFCDGEQVPILDVPHLIRHDPAHRGKPVQKDGVVRISGRSEFLARRMTDWLKQKARDEISPRAYALAERVGRPIARISVRDTRSRWGSCAPNGNLSFSWRLVMTPEWVLQYVVAHEVAHLVAPDHSPNFWKVVASLDVDARAGRKWLNANGARIQRIG